MTMVNLNKDIKWNRYDDVTSTHCDMTDDYSTCLGEDDGIQEFRMVLPVTSGSNCGRNENSKNDRTDSYNSEIGRFLIESDSEIGHLIESDEESENATLLDRIGGLAALDKFTHAFIESLGKSERLAPFFVHVPLELIRLHQRQMLQVVFDGSLFELSKETPLCDEDNDLMPSVMETVEDFLIVAHSRLFCDMGLDASHFDLVAQCFVQAGENIQVPSALVQECLTLLHSFRPAFVKGAALAKRGKTELPKQDSATNKSAAAVKENATKEDSTYIDHQPKNENALQRASPTFGPQGINQSIPPSWLLEKLSKLKNQTNPQEQQDAHDIIGPWICALAYQVTVEDPTLSPIFLSMPYMELVHYLNALMQMAFCEMDALPENAAQLLRVVRFPHGIRKPEAQLTRLLCGHLIDQFKQVTEEFLTFNGNGSYSFRERYSSVCDNIQNNLQGIYAIVLPDGENMIGGQPSMDEKSAEVIYNLDTSVSDPIIFRWTAQHVWRQRILAHADLGCKETEKPSKLYTITNNEAEAPGLQKENIPDEDKMDCPKVIVIKKKQRSAPNKTQKLRRTMLLRALGSNQESDHGILIKI